MLAEIREVPYGESVARLSSSFWAIFLMGVKSHATSRSGGGGTPRSAGVRPSRS